jgi:hypothetical protein
MMGGEEVFSLAAGVGVAFGATVGFQPLRDNSAGTNSRGPSRPPIANGRLFSDARGSAFAIKAIGRATVSACVHPSVSRWTSPDADAWKPSRGLVQARDQRIGGAYRMQQGSAYRRRPKSSLFHTAARDCSLPCSAASARAAPTGEAEPGCSQLRRTNRTKAIFISEGGPQS